MAKDSPTLSRQSEGIDTVNVTIPAVSVAAAGTLAVGVMIVFGIAIGDPVIVGIGLILGALTAATASFVSHTNEIYAGLSGLIFLASVTGSIALPVIMEVSQSVANALVVSSAILIGFGLVHCRYPVMGDGSIVRAIGWIARVTAVLVITTAIVAVVQLDLAAVVTPTTAIIEPATSTGSALGLLTVAWLCAGGIWGILAVLPPATAFTSPYQDQYHTATTGILWAAVLTFGGGSVTLATTYLIGIEAGIGTTLTNQYVAPIVESPAIRTGLLQLTVLLGIAIVGLRVLRSAVAVVLYERPAWAPSAVILAGGFTLIAWIQADQIVATSTQIGGILAELVEQGVSLTGGLTVGLALVTAGMVGVIMLATGFAATAQTGLLPISTASARLVSGGMLLGALGITVAGLRTELILLGVVTGLIAWNILGFGSEQTIAVGKAPARRDGEFVNIGIMVLIGAVSVVFTSGLYYLLTATAVNVQYGTLPLLVAVLTAVMTLLFVSAGSRQSDTS